MSTAKKAPAKKRATKKKPATATVPVADEFVEILAKLSAEAEAKAAVYHGQRASTQPGHPTGVPDGFVAYCIPSDVEDERKIALRVGLGNRGYFRDPTGSCVWPDLPGGEVYLAPESVALLAFAERRAASLAAREAASGRKGKRKAHEELIEGVYQEVLERMQESGD